MIAEPNLISCKSVSTNHRACNTTEASTVFFLSFIAILLMMERQINIYDEGIILTGAMRIASGDFIHRDFNANYGPAQFYLVAGLFKLFGSNVIVERLYDITIRAGVSTIIYSLLANHTKKSIALSATIICTGWLCSTGNPGYPIYPALLLALSSTLVMIKLTTHGFKTRYTFAAGLLTGFTAFFRYDIGFFVFVVNLLSATIASIVVCGWDKKAIHNFLWKVIPYSLGAGFPVILLLFWYYQNDAFSHFFHDIIAFPGENYASTRGLPFPNFPSLFSTFGVISAAIYLPIIICALSTITIFKAFLKTPISIKDQLVPVIFLTLLVAFFYLKGIVRVSIEHMQLAIIASIALLATLFEAARKLGLSKIPVILLTLVAAITSSLSVYKKTSTNQQLILNSIAELIQPKPITKNLSPNKLFFVDENRTSAISFIKQNVSSEQYLFVGLTRHDKIFVNDVSAYFLTERMPAVKWHHFDPGLQSSEEIQLDIISDLNKVKPPYVWLESTWNDVNEPNDSALSSNVKMLDMHLLDNYLPIANFGEIQILKRKQTIH